MITLHRSCLHHDANLATPRAAITMGYCIVTSYLEVTTPQQILAILIACLGLFALTSFTAEQRTREIGIRKVLGATTAQITWLLSASLGKLIVGSFLVAIPLAAYSIKWYIQQYAYRTEIGTLIYLEAGLLAFALAGATMGYHCVKSAAANPVHALKN